MHPFAIAPTAERDIESILIWTHENFDAAARRRYAKLLTQAILEVAENPELPGSSSRPEIASNAHTYHIAGSRNNVMPAKDRVKKPRHLLLYRVRSDGRVEIGRVLHDSMDLARHLPSVYEP